MQGDLVDKLSHLAAWLRFFEDHLAFAGDDCDDDREGVDDDLERSSRGGFRVRGSGYEVLDFRIRVSGFRIGVRGFRASRCRNHRRLGIAGCLAEALWGHVILCLSWGV